MKKIEVGHIDDSEEFAIFALFDKWENNPEDLTPIDRIALRGFGIKI
jgi:hypothetical protein